MDVPRGCYFFWSNRRGVRRQLHREQMDLTSAAEHDRSTNVGDVLVRMLAGGRVTAFTSLFYLALDGYGVAEEPKAGGIEELEEAYENNQTQFRNGSGSFTLPMHHVEHAESQLCDAEASATVNDFGSQWQSLDNLASTFAQDGMFSKALFVQRQALLAAQAAADPSSEMNAHASLGYLHEEIGNTTKAIEHYERRRRLAQLMNSIDLMYDANVSLLRARRTLAQKHFNAGNRNACTQLLQECINLANDQSGHSEELAQAHHDLARSLQSQGRLEEALEQLHDEASLCQRAGLENTLAKALYATAEVYQELGRPEDAAKSLGSFLEYAQSQGQREHADAYCLKGVLEIQQGKLEDSLASFEDFFEVARALNDQALLDAARINLGVVRGHLRQSKYMNLVANDLPSLLEWKLSRTHFPA